MTYIDQVSTQMLGNNILKIYQTAWARVNQCGSEEVYGYKLSGCGVKKREQLPEVCRI